MHIASNRDLAWLIAFGAASCVLSLNTADGPRLFHLACVRLPFEQPGIFRRHRWYEESRAEISGLSTVPGRLCQRVVNQVTKENAMSDRRQFLKLAALGGGAVFISGLPFR